MTSSGADVSRSQVSLLISCMSALAPLRSRFRTVLFVHACSQSWVSSQLLSPDVFVPFFTLWRIQRADPHTQSYLSSPVVRVFGCVSHIL